MHWDAHLWKSYEHFIAIRGVLECSTRYYSLSNRTISVERLLQGVCLWFPLENRWLRQTAAEGGMIAEGDPGGCWDYSSISLNLNFVQLMHIYYWYSLWLWQAKIFETFHRTRKGIAFPFWVTRLLLWSSRSVKVLICVSYLYLHEENNFLVHNVKKRWNTKVIIIMMIHHDYMFNRTEFVYYRFISSAMIRSWHMIYNWHYR